MGHGTLSVESLFYSAIEFGTPAERARYLDEVCRDETELRHQVERLLNAHFQAESFLDPSPALAATAAMPVVAEAPGSQIGPYKLLEQIGEGGFGVVFMAEQEQPVRRRVALKVIKPGMDTRQVIARFEAERQALALMDHPNIAKVLDAGATETGRPYFVMELVRGVPTTEYCDQHQLTPRARLELFVTVCHAVQHAHQKGVIHRDIKPTNVLVTLHDEKPVVKVIDFGVAKATSALLTEKTLFTGFAQMIGTPLYMSPEQAQMNGLDVDTRSDIYSLGVLLYELLTGTTPFDGERFRIADYDEIRRIIREEEPPRPSTRISTLRTAAAISASRKTDSHALRRQCRGELDWIVMKCLEKDRSRRYETASGLATDVQRYLWGEPVLAHPPSNFYRVRKLAWRNKGACFAAFLVGLLLLVTVLTLVFSNGRIRQEQALTNLERGRADLARKLAEKHAANERQGLEKLKAANAWLERGRWYSGRRRWDDANLAFTKALELRPDHAAAWVERGDLFALLGLWDLATADFEEEFKLREPDAPARWYRLALLRLYLGDTQGYRRTCARMRERFRGTHDMEFASEVVRASVLAADPEADLRPLLQQALHAHLARPSIWYDRYILGIVEYRSGNFAQAVEHLQGSLGGHPEWEVRALSYPVLAMALHRLGRTADARAALQATAEAIDRWTRDRYGSTDGKRWIAHFGATARWPVTWWDWLECDVYHREAKLLIDGSPPVDDPRLLVLRARALGGMRKNFAADVEYATALTLLPDDSQVRAEAHRNSAYSAIGRRDWRRAREEFSKACELMPDDVALSNCEAVAALAAGDADGYRATCSRMLSRFGEDIDRETAHQVVWACTLRGDAVADFDRVVPLARMAVLSHHDGAGVLLAALYRAGNFEEAIACFDAATMMYRPTAWDWTFAAMAHHRLGQTERASRCLAEAGGWIQAADRQTDVDLGGVLPCWGSWRTPIAYRLLLREAKQMMETEADVGGLE